LRAIALYWEDPSFKEELLNPDGDHTDKTAVLSKFFGYNNPWNFAINFKECKTFILDKDDDSEFDYPANIISLGKPRKPELPGGPNSSKGIYPIALAAYNDDGKSYPFTCC
jgi:ribosomally synthesized peptide (two-chain TOMM family)